MSLCYTLCMCGECAYICDRCLCAVCVYVIGFMCFYSFYMNVWVQDCVCVCLCLFKCIWVCMCVNVCSACVLRYASLPIYICIYACLFVWECVSRCGWTFILVEAAVWQNKAQLRCPTGHVELVLKAWWKSPCQLSILSRTCSLGRVRGTGGTQH